MSKVIWTQSALDDLAGIQDYISRDSVYYAERFVDDIFASVDRLKLFPRSGRKVPERNSTDLREILFGSYRVIYKIKDEDVFIIAIVHSKRNYRPK